MPWWDDALVAIPELVRPVVEGGERGEKRGEGGKGTQTPLDPPSVQSQCASGKENTRSWEKEGNLG